MIYANTNMDEAVCDIPKLKVVDELKEPGIYERTKDTRELLTEVLFMLDRFKREIGDYTNPLDERASEPTCFRDDVERVQNLAFAIREDLSRIMSAFN